ncbi:katanin p80 WD40 repeat-containing subunit B1 [Trichonephila clavipes]|nr:katanin p80 WD40 repeat-containing subunit B1 [Trichonephila clavipes]
MSANPHASKCLQMKHMCNCYGMQLVLRRDESEEFVAHGASVTCLALGRKSGRVMVTGGEDKKVNLWAVGKSNCIMSLSGHTSTIECVKFGQCEDIVCAGSSSGALKIWDLEAAKIIRTLLGHKGNVKCVDFHPYGDFVASGSSDSNIKLWDKRRKGSIFTYKKVTPARAPLCFSLAFFKSSQSHRFSFCFTLLRLRAKTAWLLAACHNGQPDCTLSAAVRIPFSLSMDTRGESETYKKDGTDKDYTTNTQRFNI